MIEIRSLRDLLRLLFIYQREFKLAALSAVVIIVLGAFLLPAKYESNARLLVKPGRDSTLPIEISNRQALVMPSTQRDPIVDEERLLTGRPIVRQVAERYLEVLANRPPPEGLWKRTKFYVKKAIGAVFDGIRVTLETFGVIEETTAVERLAKDLEKKFEVTHAAGSTVMEISFTWSEPEVAQEVVKAWIEIYMEERTQALGRKSLYAFYEAQTADSAAQIKSYKAQILKHLNEIGASSIEDRLQDLSERINVLRGERFNSIRLIASSDSALESTRQQLKGLPREIVTVRQIAKLKVLEALAAGLPLASTAQGVSGLELRDGEDYLGGESAEQLANAVVRLLQDPAQARALGENGRAYVRRAHDWSVAASQLEQVYAGLAEGAPACA